MFDSPIQFLLYLISERLHPVQKIHLKMCLPNRNKYLQFKNGGFSDSSSCLFSHEVHTDILLSVMARCATLTDHLPVNKSSLDWTPMVSYIFRNIVDSSCWPLLSYTTQTAFGAMLLTVGGSTNQCCHRHKIVNRRSKATIPSFRQHYPHQLVTRFPIP